MYTTIAAVREVIGRTAVKNEKVTDGRVQDAIEASDALINGYLAGSYQIPLTREGVAVDDDPMMAKLSTDLAAYDVVLTYQGSATIEDGDPIIRRHGAALQTLQSVSTGKIQFPYDTAAESEGDQATLSTFDLYEGYLFIGDDFFGGEVLHDDERLWRRNR